MPIIFNNETAAGCFFNGQYVEKIIFNNEIILYNAAAIFNLIMSEGGISNINSGKYPLGTRITITANLDYYISSLIINGSDNINLASEDLLSFNTSLTYDMDIVVEFAFK